MQKVQALKRPTKRTQRNVYNLVMNSENLVERDVRRHLQYDIEENYPGKSLARSVVPSCYILKSLLLIPF